MFSHPASASWHVALPFVFSESAATCGTYDSLLKPFIKFLLPQSKSQGNASFPNSTAAGTIP
jgi:hypothetical protein